MLLAFLAGATLLYAPPPSEFECIPEPRPAGNRLVGYICTTNEDAVALHERFMRSDGTPASDYERAEITQQVLSACVITKAVFLAAVDRSNDAILNAALSHCSTEVMQFEMYLQATAPNPAAKEYDRKAYFTGLNRDLDAAIISLRSGLVPAFRPQVASYAPNK